MKNITWHGLALSNPQYRKNGSYDTVATSRQLRRILARETKKMDELAKAESEAVNE